MKIQIEIDENKILELAKTTSIDDLPRSIYYQAKKEAIDVAVKELKEKLSERQYYTNEERLKSEVQKYLFEGIKSQVGKMIADKFNEKELHRLIDRDAETIITSWLEEKIYKRLEELKKDIFIGSTGELDAEREAMADSQRAEAEALADSERGRPY